MSVLENVERELRKYIIDGFGIDRKIFFEKEYENFTPYKSYKLINWVSDEYDLVGFYVDYGKIKCIWRDNGDSDITIEAEIEDLILIVKTIEKYKK